MVSKKREDNKKREEVIYEYLYLDLPLEPMPIDEKRQNGSKEQRGVIVIDLMNP
jgi:hypothetical protein